MNNKRIIRNVTLLSCLVAQIFLSVIIFYNVYVCFIYVYRYLIYRRVMYFIYQFSRHAVMF